MPTRSATSRDPVSATSGPTSLAANALSDDESHGNIPATPATKRRRAKNSAEPSSILPARRSARISSRGPTSELPTMTPASFTVPPVLEEDAFVETEPNDESSVASPSTVRGDENSRPAEQIETILTGGSTVPSVPSSSTSTLFNTRHLEPARHRTTGTAVSSRRVVSGGRRNVSGQQKPDIKQVIKTQTIELPLKKTKSLIPGWLRFPVVVVSSMVLNTALYSALNGFGVLHGELARISIKPEDSGPVGLVLAWRVTELAVSWLAGFDDCDVLSLTLLTHLPHLLFLHTFYRLDAFPLACMLLTDAISSALPFALLRARSDYHSFPGPDSTMPEGRRGLIGDPGAVALTSSFAALSYAISLVASYRLPLLLPFLASTFEGLDTFEVAHEWAASPPFGPRSILALAACLLPLGAAAQSFLFNSAATIPIVDPVVEVKGGDGVKHATFDPVTATLGETVKHNLTPPAAVTATRTRTLFFRTFVLLVLALANAAIRTGGTIKGGELYGGLAWGAVWSLAHCFISAMYWWFGYA